MELLDIKILNNAVERQLNKELSRLGITYAQSTVVAFLSLHTEERICQKDIECRLGLSHPTVSSILRRMEEKGMVESRPLESDRRCHAISLTEKSREMSGSIRENIQGITERVLEGISPEEEAELERLLQRMIRNATG